MKMKLCFPFKLLLHKVTCCYLLLFLKFSIQLRIGRALRMASCYVWIISYKYCTSWRDIDAVVFLSLLPSLFIYLFLFLGRNLEELLLSLTKPGMHFPIVCFHLSRCLWRVILAGPDLSRHAFSIICSRRLWAHAYEELMYNIFVILIFVFFPACSPSQLMKRLLKSFIRRSNPINVLSSPSCLVLILQLLIMPGR